MRVISLTRGTEETKEPRKRKGDKPRSRLLRRNRWFPVGRRVGEGDAGDGAPGARM